MGEQPIFTTKAHVFQIDPNTKKKWLPASSQAISVSYYYDSTRNSYRIISVEGSKAVINSTISPNMMFTKTSQKFGQWSDPRANTVYGLGFASEAELSKFIEKFKEVKELTRQALQKAPAQTNGTQNNDTNNHVQAEATASPVALSKPASLSSLPQSDSSSLGESRNSGSAPSLPTNTTEAQLKYENDRLKIALAQSSTNAKKWEVELQTLKNNNARLTTALQESTANVEEWKKQLAMYKEESARMKKKALEIEKGGNPGADAVLTEQMAGLSLKMSDLEKDNLKKEQEISQLNKKLEEIRLQKDEIQQEKDSLQKKLEAKETAEGQENQRLLSLQWQLSSKVSELSELSNQLVKKS